MDLHTGKGRPGNLGLGLMLLSHTQDLYQCRYFIFLSIEAVGWGLEPSWFFIQYPVVFFSPIRGGDL